MQSSIVNVTKRKITILFISLGVFSIVLVLLGWLGTAALAASGDLDETFDNDGKVTTDIWNHGNYGHGIAIQADNKIIVAGYVITASQDDFALARYNNDGSLDTTFDDDGVVTTDFIGFDDKGNSVVIQNDGKVIVAGSSFNGSLSTDFALTRYNHNGSLDTTFGQGGKVTTDFWGHLDIGYSMTLQRDGKIIVAGRSYNGATSLDFAVARYHPDGSLDTSFGGDGKVTTDLGSDEDTIRSVVVQEDGKIIAAGFSGVVENADFALVRYNSDGSLDDTFDNDGIVITDFNGDEDRGYSVGLQPDGKIVVAGESKKSRIYFALARYNGDGSLDDTFDDDGKVTTLFGNSAYGQSVLVHPDGPIVVAGYGYDINTGYNFRLAQYTPNGDLDTTFSSDGTMTTDFGGSGDRGYSIALQPDGRLLVAGRAYMNGTGYDFGLARYLGFPNQLPQAHDDSYAGNEDDALTTGNVLTNDIDLDGDALSVNYFQTGPTLGSVVDNADGTFDYDPNGQFDWLAAGEQGSDTFLYTISDGKNAMDTAVVTITIDGRNDVPIAVDDSADTAEDTARTIAVLGNDQDVDLSDSLSITAVSFPDNGTASIREAHLIYTPTINFNGRDVFTYTISDKQGSMSSATVTMTVGAVNDPPTAFADTKTIDEDTVAILNTLLNNDTDPEGDTLTILAVGTPLSGTSVLQDMHVWYTPTQDFNGTDIFTYTMSDGQHHDTALVTVTIQPINDPPIAMNDVVTTSASLPIVVSVLANDLDVVERDLITVTAVAEPLHGEAVMVSEGILYTPSPGFMGIDQFMYTISDGDKEAIATVTVYVKPHQNFLPMVFRQS